MSKTIKAMTTKRTLLTAATFLSVVVAGQGFLASQAFAGSKVKLAEKTVTQFGGPETRTRCIGYASGKWPWPIKGRWKTCNEWATDLKQHRVYVELHGPQGMDGKQLTQIKDACMASAVAAGIATGGNKTAIVSAFGACIEATEGLANAVGMGVSLEVKSGSFW